ncbi:hypothetical protein TNCV_2802361 [Trichonephila clavipes]|nr:hypothetical protein TNCV_2802361 [Trichonephila clavipes]
MEENVRKKYQGLFSQCRRDRSVYRSFIWFSIYGDKRSQSIKTFVLEEPLVVGTKTEGTGGRSVFLFQSETVGGVRKAHPCGVDTLECDGEIGDQRSKSSVIVEE